MNRRVASKNSKNQDILDNRNIIVMSYLLTLSYMSVHTFLDGWPALEGIEPRILVLQGLCSVN